jgi:hypothetical protein
MGPADDVKAIQHALKIFFDFIFQYLTGICATQHDENAESSYVNVTLADRDYHRRVIAQSRSGRTKIAISSWRMESGTHVRTSAGG